MPFPQGLGYSVIKTRMKSQLQPQINTFAFTGESHVAKLWGPQAAMKGIYGVSLPALHRKTDDGLKTKLPTWGKNKKKAQLVTEKRDIYLAH